MTTPEPLDARPDRPLVLVSNDDGIDAAGIAALAAALDGIGTVAVVAPLAEQSAVGHAITVRDPMRVPRLAVRRALGRRLGPGRDGDPGRLR